MLKKELQPDLASSEEEHSLRKIIFQWGLEFESCFHQKYSKSFSHANILIKRNPDSSKYATRIWNWMKHNLLETSCSYLSLS